MMTQCPHCRESSEVNDALNGLFIQCPACGRGFRAGPIAVAPVSAVPPPLPPAGPPFTSPIPRARLAAAFLIAGIALSVVSVWSSQGQLDLLRRIERGDDVGEPEIESNDRRESAIGLLGLAVHLPGVVLYLCWKYRAYKNLGPLQAGRMRFSPGGSVGWYFCPLLNLYKPVQAMGDIADGSIPPGQVGRGVRAIIPFWWLVWILDGVASQVAFRAALRAEGVSALVGATNLDIASSGLTIVSNALTLLLVWRLSRAQVERWRALAGPANPEVPVGGPR